MVYRRFIRRNSGHHKVKPKILFVLVIIAIIIFFIDLTVRPILNRAISYQSKLITTSIISEVVSSSLFELQLGYGDIVKLSKGNDEQVSSIEIDATIVNKVKAKIVSDITVKLNQIKNYKYQIPLGTVLNNDFLLDRGPLINFKITPMGSARAELSSEFSSKGINQTHHKIILNITVDTTTLIPLHNSSSELKTDFVIAETVIIGKVPNYYTNVESDDQQLKSDLVDYGYRR